MILIIILITTQQTQTLGWAYIAKGKPLILGQRIYSPSRSDWISSASNLLFLTAIGSELLHPSRSLCGALNGSIYKQRWQPKIGSFLCGPENLKDYTQWFIAMVFRRINYTLYGGWAGSLFSASDRNLQWIPLDSRGRERKREIVRGCWINDHYENILLDSYYQKLWTEFMLCQVVKRGSEHSLAFLQLQIERMAIEFKLKMIEKWLTKKQSLNLNSRHFVYRA